MAKTFGITDSKFVKPFFQMQLLNRNGPKVKQTLTLMFTIERQQLKAQILCFKYVFRTLEELIVKTGNIRSNVSFFLKSNMHTMSVSRQKQTSCQGSYWMPNYSTVSLMPSGFCKISNLCEVTFSKNRNKVRSQCTW